MKLTLSQYYAPDYELDVRPSNMDNANSREYLDKIRVQVIENLKKTTFAPSVQMTDVPRESMAMNDEDEAALDDLDEDQNPDKRITQRRFDKQVEKEGEFSDSDDEDMAEANGVRHKLNGRKRRQMLNYRNIMEPVDSGVDSAMDTPQAGSSLPDQDMAMGDAPLDETFGETPSPVQIVNESPNVSGGQSPQAADDKDVAMEDRDDTATIFLDPAPHEEVNVQQQTTPPESPRVIEVATAVPPTVSNEGTTANAILKQEVVADDPAVAAQEAGVKEAAEEDAQGQAKAAQEQKAEE